MLTRKSLSAVGTTLVLAVGGISVASADHMMGRGMWDPETMMGMDGRGMMSPGMGGYGMGPGMMGPGMGGYGMMGPGILDLDPAQRTQIQKIQQDARKKHFDLMTQLGQEQYKLQDLYMADKRDPKAIGEQYKKVQEVQRLLVEASVDTQNRTENVLTEEQKNQLRGAGHWWGGMSRMHER